MALSDSGLIARYYADEAASGQTPTAVLDSSGVAPVDDLGIIYGNNLAYTEVGGNRGLNSSFATGDGVALSGVLAAGDKFFDSLQGSSEATLEYVVDITDYNTNGGRLFGFMNGNSGNGTFLMTGDSSGGTNAEIRVNGSIISDDVGTITGKHVIHLVMDSTQAVADDRIRLYIDGVLQTGLNVTLSQNTTLSFSQTRLIVMNRPARNRAVEGTFFYGAVYSEAFDQTRVTAHQTPISTDDDTPSVTDINAEVAATLDANTLTSDTSLVIEANLAALADDVGLSADAVVIGTIIGDASNELDDVGLISATGIAIELNGSTVLDDIDLTAVTNLTGGLTAALTSTLDDVVVSASTITELAAVLTNTLDDVTITSSVVLPTGANLSSTLDDVTVTGAASAFILGETNVTFEGLLLSSETTVLSGRVVSFTTTLDDVLVTSSVNVDISASLGAALDDTGVSSLISIDVVVETSGITLDDVTLSAVAGAVVRYIECTLVTREGVERPNLSSLSWAWFDAPDPVDFVAPTDTGEIETTDGIGVINIQLPSSGLATGQVGSLVLRADDGTLMAAYNLAVI